MGTINFGSICAIKNKKKVLIYIGHVLHSHHPPSSLFVEVQTRRAGRVLDGTGVWPLQEFGTFCGREVLLNNLKITQACKNRCDVCQVCQLTSRVMMKMFAQLTSPKYVKE